MEANKLSFGQLCSVVKGQAMKSRYKYLVYLSLLFLAVALYKADYLKAPRVTLSFGFIGSFIFLFAGFIGIAVSWKQVLIKSTYRVGLYECFAGIGLSVFSKYIPGKIWGLVGPAVYAAERGHYPLGELSAISLNAQFIDLWVALAFGALGLFLLCGLNLWGWLVLLLWLGLTVVIFSRLVHGSAERLIRIVLRKKIKIPSLTTKSTISVMPWFMLYWMLWSTGFYILVVSLTKVDVSWAVGLGFPLAGALGTMALIAPAGLVAREGVVVGYLTLAGIPIMEATTIAVTSRLWFLLGEVFIFIVGWSAHRLAHRGIHRTDSFENANADCSESELLDDQRRR